MRRATNVSTNGEMFLASITCGCNLALLQVGREQLVSLGQCIGKLTHSGKFRLTIGALDVLASHAKYKVGQLTCCDRMHTPVNAAYQLRDDPLGLKTHEGQSTFHLSTEGWTLVFDKKTVSVQSVSIIANSRCMMPYDATNSVFKLTTNEE